jgi:hypothetical protein
MFSKDLKTETTSASLMIATVTANANGTGVDIRDYIANLLIVANVKQGTGTTPTLDLKIQDSADNSSFADVSGYTFTQVTNSADSFQTLSADTRNLRRYIRVVATVGGTTPSFVTSVSFTGYKQTV